MISKEDVVLGIFDLELARLLDMYGAPEYLHSPSFMNATIDRLVTYYKTKYENDRRVPLNIPTPAVKISSKNNGLYRFMLEAVSFALSRVFRCDYRKRLPRIGGNLGSLGYQCRES
jgi:hypothetical protein